MIKNRESAARSRQRKQAYMMELEAEVAKLKELNDELQKKQVCLYNVCIFVSWVALTYESVSSEIVKFK